MKVVFDCIVTQSADRCSTVIQFVTLANMLLEQPDVFIYWPVPASFGKEDYDFLPKSDRIQYIPVFMATDRMKEYNRLPEYLTDMLYFHGSHWDWDVIVTVRTCQVPMMRVLATGIRTPHFAWTKRILVIEDMMILSKKPSVGQSNPDVQDRMTIEGYIAADKVFMPAYHQIPWVMEVAKQHFSFARCRELVAKIQEVCHLNMPSFSTKADLYDKSRKLEVAFVGRTSRHGSRLGEINELFLRQFILHDDIIHPFVCTVSNSNRGLNDEIIDVYRPNREEFHKIARTKMDLAVYFYVDVELNMSMLEPISMGVPALVPDAPWSRAMVGDDYPFFVSIGTQSYAMVLEFQKNYKKNYDKFVVWFNEWFVPTYTKRMAEDGMYTAIVDAITAPLVGFEERHPTIKNNVVVKELVNYGGNELSVTECIKEGGTAHFGSLPVKVSENWRSVRGLAWSTSWNDYRLSMKASYGYEDASVKVGHLRKIA